MAHTSHRKLDLTLIVKVGAIAGVVHVRYDDAGVGGGGSQDVSNKGVDGPWSTKKVDAIQAKQHVGLLVEVMIECQVMLVGQVVPMHGRGVSMLGPVLPGAEIGQGLVVGVNCKQTVSDVSVQVPRGDVLAWLLGFWYPAKETSWEPCLQAFH